jgi:hypothetical protein
MLLRWPQIYNNCTGERLHDRQPNQMPDAHPLLKSSRTWLPPVTVLRFVLRTLSLGVAPSNFCTSSEIDFFHRGLILGFEITVESYVLVNRQSFSASVTRD